MGDNQLQHLVSLQSVSKTYKMGEATITAVDDVSFDIEHGQFVVVVGPSGAGKTTVLNILGGMDSATSGRVIVGDKDLFKLNSRQLTMYRRNDVGFVFQFYNLMPNLTAYENIELATEICKDVIPTSEILGLVGLQDRAHNFPSQLSGGEQQRVSIARALAKNPKILLCDEPTGALDYDTGKRILQLLQDVCKTKHRTVIVVTHNTALKDMADKVIVFKNGKVVDTVYNKLPMSVQDIEW